MTKRLPNCFDCQHWDFGLDEAGEAVPECCTKKMKPRWFFRGAWDYGFHKNCGQFEYVP